MNIVLCIKQVPDTSDIKWTENNTIQREGLESIINPYDIYAIESALKLKRSYDNVEITALTMGPFQAVDMLKKTIAIGVDNGILLSDKKFAAADTYATGKTIGTAIREKIPNFDLIICGQFAIDGDTAQTGPSIANTLNLPQVTYVQEIISYEDGALTVRRELDDGTEIVKVKLPALICVLKDYFEPTRAKINGIIKAQNAEIKTYGFDDLNLSAEEVGLKGSPTYVSRAFRPAARDIQCHKCTDCGELAEKIKICGGLDE
ncbi:TPA: electron transfer flavoprotein subunit beta/FixA family protein [Candidatus Scatousia excrementigallinarum]|uniref:Electron transfer flavoprotein subunit beta/FixA family protein n=1 Tax=Candidatus Scatousia excrementigallinarum TaxID=2840935 RepID=A0A9D1F051_9BACT|nr:electron transfer flavoprotein subunit beta/FixA family protein [Candidatus Scatousia excrementigallinarum]